MRPVPSETYDYVIREMKMDSLIAEVDEFSDYGPKNWKRFKAGEKYMYAYISITGLIFCLESVLKLEPNEMSNKTLEIWHKGDFQRKTKVYNWNFRKHFEEEPIKDKYGFSLVEFGNSLKVWCRLAHTNENIFVSEI